ncbi:hypothetical protein Tco_0818338 [Tanacetum coccineum]
MDDESRYDPPLDLGFIWCNERCLELDAHSSIDNGTKGATKAMSAMHKEEEDLDFPRTQIKRIMWKVVMAGRNQPGSNRHHKNKGKTPVHSEIHPQELHFPIRHHSWIGVTQGYIPLSYISLTVAKSTQPNTPLKLRIGPTAKASLSWHSTYAGNLPYDFKGSL